jgi:hypothetical protein
VLPHDSLTLEKTGTLEKNAKKFTFSREFLMALKFAAGVP